MQYGEVGRCLPFRRRGLTPIITVMSLGERYDAQMDNQPRDLDASVERCAMTVDALSAQVDRLRRLLDEVEPPLRTLAPHLARAAGPVARLADVAALLTEASRTLGPLSAFLKADRSGGSSDGADERGPAV